MVSRRNSTCVVLFDQTLYIFEYVHPLKSASVCVHVVDLVGVHILVMHVQTTHTPWFKQSMVTVYFTPMVANNL